MSLQTKWEDFRYNLLETLHIDFVTYYTVMKTIKAVLRIIPIVVLVCVFAAGMYYEATYGLGAHPLACQSQHNQSNIFIHLHNFIHH